MRPLRLTLQGFRSHENRTEFDFSERTLFAIVGPMGSGKTSILDGISFALYAKTPKVQRTTKSLICSTKESAEIELVFEAEDRTYTINRSIRTRGAPIHVLTDDAGEKTTGEAAVTAAVEELLRLDFDAFRSSVLLAQNQFDEFFKASPGTRMKILKGVFRFDQLDDMREAAKNHRNEHELAAREFEGGLKEIPEDAETQISAAKVDLAAVDDQVKALEKVGPAEQKLFARLERAGEELAVTTTALEELETLSGTVPSADVMTNLVAVEEQVQAPLEKATKRVAELKAGHEKARESLASLEKELGKETTLVALSEKATRLDELSAEIVTAAATIKDSKTALAAAKKANDATAAAEKKARAALEGLENERLALHRQDAAHGLRQGLKPGDTCPVCEQPVLVVPTAKVSAAFKTIDDRVTAAKAEVDTASTAARNAADTYVSAQHAAAAAQKSAEDLRSKARKLEEDLVAALGKKRDPAAEVRARVTRIADASETVVRADSDLAEARDELEERKKEKEEFDELRDQLVDDLAHVASALKRPRLDRKAPGKDLAAAAVSFAELLAAEFTTATKKLGELGQAEQTIRTEMQTLYKEAGLAPGQTVSDALAGLRESRGTLSAHIKNLKKDIERSRELVNKLQGAREQMKIYETLFADLANTKFIDFLLEDKRRALSELASAQLLEMTGRYRFDDQGTFNVIDEFNADKERGVDSLSGGETFLASLALALGLAESVTRHGGRLQCFFLDEGFGSLDADALEKALDGIERIATQDRLIGLVSHTQGVAERIVDKIGLGHDDDGMTIVKDSAVPDLQVVR